MNGIFISEFIGTFILVISILITGNPLFITAAFLAAITIAKLSGGHLNPVVTLAAWLNKSINNSQIIMYLSPQILASILAYFVFKNIS